jgi:YHS domain-containing protein
VSGVVFQVKASSARREAFGKPVYFCCEKCAMYFSEHREHVLAVRGFSPSP